MRRFIITLMAGALLLAGCENGSGNEETGDKQITIADQKQLTQIAAADEETTGSGFTFTAKSDWTATVTETSKASPVEWLTLLHDGEETYSGEAGTFSMTIKLTVSELTTKRTASIVIKCGDDSITVTVEQGAAKDSEEEEDGDRKLVAKIVETASLNSDYFDNNGPFEPYSYEFKYDQEDRLTEYIIKEYNGDLYDKFTYSYAIQGELRITDNYANMNTIPLNSAGYIKSAEQPYDGTLFYTYDSEGRLQKVEPEGDYYQKNSYELTWSDGNPVSIQSFYYDSEWNNDTEDYEWIKKEGWSTFTTFSTERNNKTTIDLNIFFFGLIESDGPYWYYPSTDAEYLCALTGLVGRRANNLMISTDCDYGEVANKVDIYTEATVPAVGSVVLTRYSRNFDGDAEYTFNDDDCPASFIRRMEVVKTEFVYNGEREYINTDGNEALEQDLENMYGPGPWFRIILDAGTPTTSYDTHTWTISYKE